MLSDASPINNGARGKALEQKHIHAHKLDTQLLSYTE